MAFPLDDKDDDDTPRKQPVEVDVNNNNNAPVTVHWIENGQKKSLTIPANDRAVAKVTKHAGQPIRMTATNEAGQPVYINGRKAFDLDPQTLDRTRSFVHVGQSKFYPEF